MRGNHKYLVGALLILLCTELFLQAISFGRYLAASYRYQKTITNNWYLAGEGSWWNQESHALAPVYHPLLAFTFKDYHTAHINIDSDASRRTLHNPEPAAEATDIFFFGGSSMAGYGVKDGETIASYVANVINADNPAYRVTNFGQFAYNSNQEVMSLLLKLKEGIVPDVAVFYDGCNELYTARSSPGETITTIPDEARYAQALDFSQVYDENKPVNTSLVSGELWSRFIQGMSTRVKLIHYPFRLVRIVWDHLHPELTPVEIEPQLAARARQAAENYIYNARVIDALAREYHFQYLLVWQPIGATKPLTPQETAVVEPELAPMLEEMKREFAKASMPHMIDIGSIIKEQSDRPLFFDSCHLSPEGNRIVATAIINALRENGLL